MNLQPVPVSGNSVVPTNDNFGTLDWASVYGMDPRTTQNLDWVYYGGMWAGFTIIGGLANKLTLIDDDVNYIVVALVDGAISVSTSSTNWDDTGQYRRVYRVTTVGGQVSLIEDFRAGPGGIHAGIAKPEPIVWRVVTDADIALVIGDAENGVAGVSAGAHNLNVPTNTSVPFPVGTSILISQDGTGQITIVPAGGVTINVNAALTLKLSTQWSVASLVKRGTDVWQLSGDLEAV